MKIYILGAASKATDAMVEKYYEAEKQLAAQGHNVVNIMHYTGWHVESEKSQTACRINYMTKCDAVCVLDDWQTDKIAQFEFAIAALTNMKMLFANGVPKPHKVSFIIP